MLLAPQTQHLQRSGTALVYIAREVVEPFDLPTVGLGDATVCPREYLLLAPQLRHRLAHPDELARRTEIPAKQRHNRLPVTIEDGQALARPAHREGPLPVPAFIDRTTVRQEPTLTEGVRISNRIDLEEVLVLAAETHHPCRELHRIGDARVTDLGVNVKQFAHEIADRPVGIVGVHDHLHDMPDRTLHQDDKILRRRRRGSQTQLFHDRPRGSCPLRALAISEEPPRPQPTIHLGPKLRQVACLARRRQPHMPLDVVMPVGSRDDDLMQNLGREVAHHLPEILPLTSCSAHHAAILAPRR